MWSIPVTIILALPWVAALAWFVYWVITAPATDATTAGKYTVDFEGDFVIFILGVYVHPRRLPWSLPAFIRAARALFAIRAELEAEPAHGCLQVVHTDALLGHSPTRLVQIWRSYDHLAAYARNRMGKHLGTWLAWNADAKRFAGGQVPGVGIYHEAFLVSAGQYEAVYRNVPPYGLARLGRVVGAMEGRMRSAKGRLGRGDGGDHAEVEGSGGNGAVCPAAAACPVAAK